MAVFQKKVGLRFPLSPKDWEGQPVNDALPYGVTIRPAKVPPGEPYWKVVRVHHLTAEENQGHHHLFLEVLDEHGRRVTDAHVRVVSESGEKVIRLAGDERQPAVAFPMEKWAIYDVDVLGLPSDRVMGLSAAHPDEGKGNESFRHSFLVVWQRTVAPVADLSASPLEEPTAVAAEEDVEEVPAETAPTAVTAAAETRPEEAMLPSPAPVSPEPEPESAQPPSEVEEPPLLDTYVLFVNAQDPKTLAAFFVLMDEIAAAGVPFGFDTLDVAARARRVIVVGELSPEMEEPLATGSREVVALSGDGKALLEGWTQAFSAG